MILAALYHLEWHALNDHSLRSEEVFGLMTKLVLLINLKLRHGVFLNLSYNWWKCSWVKKHVFFFIPTQGHAHWPQREEGREKEREKNIHAREKHLLVAWLPLRHALTLDQTCNPGMCLASNRICDLLVYGTILQSTESHRPGWNMSFSIDKMGALAFQTWSKI